MKTLNSRTLLASIVLMAATSLAASGAAAQQIGNSDDPQSKRAFPAEGFGVALSIDQPRYWTDFMPPGVQPPTVGMKLTVYNNSDQKVTFQFPSSQRYDFAIRDSSGREVWRWSDGKAFLQVLGSLTLKPGEAVMFKAEHELVDDAGNPLPEGVYTVLGELTARDGQSWVKRTMEGRTSFRHSYVY